MKKTITIIGILILVLHFTLITLYSYNNLIPDSFLLKLSRHYTYPVFDQNFQLFAPNPPTCKQVLYYRCLNADTTYTNWINPGVDLLKQHHANRFGYAQKRYNIYESIHRQLLYAHESTNYLLNEHKLSNEKYDSVINTLYQFQLAKKYFLSEANKTHKKVQDIEFIAVSICLPNNDSTTITFPEIKF